MRANKKAVTLALPRTKAAARRTVFLLALLSPVLLSPPFARPLLMEESGE